MDQKLSNVPGTSTFAQSSHREVSPTHHSMRRGPRRGVGLPARWPRSMYVLKTRPRRVDCLALAPRRSSSHGMPLVALRFSNGTRNSGDGMEQMNAPFIHDAANFRLGRSYANFALGCGIKLTAEVYRVAHST